jgi:acetoin utilization deacetylase AcuC-like enzyme
MASLLLNLAQKFAGGKVAFLLEGGYNLKALKSSVAAVLQIISGVQRIDLAPQASGKKVEVIIRKILRLREPYW